MRVCFYNDGKLWLEQEYQEQQAEQGGYKVRQNYKNMFDYKWTVLGRSHILNVRHFDYFIAQKLSFYITR